ncbi:MAG: hypothetical protein IKI09_12190 [Bacteroidales bacterium]|nr:hypothetical protein [Bacteroidales bacterium]
MKRTILTLTLLLATAFPAFAQVEEEIQQSKTERIAKGRAYLLERFFDRDYDKVMEAKDYLLTLEDDNYAVFAPAEYWHVLLWTKEFDELTSSMRAFDSTQFVAYKNKVKPQRDQLSEQVSRRSIEDEHLLRFNLQEAQLPAEDFDFLSLFLDWDLKPYSPENQKQWNEKSDKFLEEFPNSDYEWFVRHLIRVKMETEKWVWGFNIGLGSGVFTQDLNEWMRGAIGGCAAIEASYKRVRFAAYMDGMDIKLRENPSEKGDGSIIAFNVSVGYDLVGTRRISLTPFAAVGVGQVSSKILGSIPELVPLTKWRMNYEIGTDFDFRFFQFKTEGPLPLYIRLRYWYDLPSMGRIGPELSGGCHCFLLGIGISITGEKRVY